MPITLRSVSVFVFGLLFLAGPTTPAWAQAPTGADKDNALYSIGVLMSRQLVSLELSEEEFAQVQRGLSDALNGRELVADPEDHRESIKALQQSREKTASAAEAAKAAAFIAAAEKEPGAEKTATGLIYIEEKAGTGASPGPDDTVEVHYHGTLRDGSVFDSSVERGTPAKFPLGRVIPCWTEGLQRMKVGGKARLVCPSAIAYGDRGAPPRIAGGAALSFEVELLGIEGR